MIKIPYTKFGGANGPAFLQTVQKILDINTDGHTSYRLQKIFIPVVKGMTQVYEDYKKDILDKYAKRDEKGEYNIQAPILPQPGEETHEEYAKALSAFEAKELEIERPFLVVDDFKDGKMTPREMSEIDFLIAAEEAGTQKKHLRVVK